MAIALEQKNLLNYLTAFQERVSRRTNINLFDRDSKTQALIDVFSEQLLTDRKDSIAAFNSLQISQAQGDALIKLGQARGLQPLAETFATVNRSELSLAFYVDSGTFGSINGGSTFVIPKGTKVSSSAKQNDLGQVIVYVLTEDVTCTNTETLAYASARAEASGSDFNVGASTLRNHNFSNYTDGTGLLVINFYSILNGRKQETSDQYRFRLSQFYTTVASTNETRAQLVALTVPGVLDTKILPGHFGIGTIGLVVLGTEFQASVALVNAVQQAINNLTLPGVKVTAVPAVNALVDIEVTVKATRTLSSADQARIRNNLRRISTNYLRSKGLNGTISIADLARLWGRYSNGIVQFSTAAVNIFDNVYIRRGYVTASASERETLEGVFYTLQRDEFADLGSLTITFE